MTEWLMILMLSGRELAASPVDPYRCRQTELRIASGCISHYQGKLIMGAVCLRRPAIEPAIGICDREGV